VRKAVGSVGQRKKTCATIKKHQLAEKPADVEPAEPEITAEKQAQTDEIPSAEENLTIDDSLSDEQHLATISQCRDDNQLAPYLTGDCSRALKKAARKKLFQSSFFQHRDGLDDYDEDFKIVETISAEFVATMNAWINNPEEAEPRQLALQKKDQATKAAPEQTVITDHGDDIGDSDVAVNAHSGTGTDDNNNDEVSNNDTVS